MCFIGLTLGCQGEVDKITLTFCSLHRITNFTSLHLKHNRVILSVSSIVMITSNMLQNFYKFKFLLGSGSQPFLVLVPVTNFSCIFVHRQILDFGQPLIFMHFLIHLLNLYYDISPGEMVSKSRWLRTTALGNSVSKKYLKYQTKWDFI